MNPTSNHLFLTLAALSIFQATLLAQFKPEDSGNPFRRLSSVQTRDLDNGGLHVFSEMTLTRIDTNPVPDDFYAELKTEFINGKEDKSYGLIFRAQDSLNFYAFLIQPSGKYSLQLRRYWKNKPISWSSITKWTSDSNIIRNGVNYLKVRCVKDSIILFINGIPVKGLRDKTYSNGKTGLYAEGGVHIHFQELKIGAKPPETVYEFMPAADSMLSLKPDSATKCFYDFLETKPDWANEPENYFERGFYRMHLSEQYPSHTIGCGMENFTMEMNVRIMRWDSAGLLRVMYHVGKYSHEQKGISLESDSVVKYFNDYHTADTKPLIVRIPFQYDSGRAVHLKLDVQDTDVKLSIDGVERILIIDERFNEPVRGYFKLYLHRLSADIHSIRISSRPIDEYGLASTMPTCAVYRLSPPKETTFKPPVRKEKSKNPVVKFFKQLERDMDEWFWVMVFGIAVLLVSGIIMLIARIRGNKKFNSMFENMFLKYMTLQNGSAGLKQIAKHFGVSPKKTLKHISRFADQHQILLQVAGNQDMLIVIPGLMIALPETCEPVLQKLTDSQSPFRLTPTEAKRDLLTLMRIASVNGNRLSVGILQREYDVQPDRICFFKNIISQKNRSFSEEFEKSAYRLFNSLVEEKNIIKDTASDETAVIIAGDFIRAIIDLNK